MPYKPRPYRPRKQSKRWLDADCPKGVLAIFDNPNFADRYTILYAPTTDHMWIDYRSASSSPFHPCGVCLYDQMSAHKAEDYCATNSHRKCKWSSLPNDVKTVVRRDLEE